jgi:predicted aldo/keto reductase-like oxidoreductase
MSEKHERIDRRSFLKTMGAVGVGSALASTEAIAEPNAVDPNAPAKTKEPKYPQVPKRKLGKTGVEVPVLSLGAMFNFLDKQIILRKALQWGVSYWDTSPLYAGENSERGIGKFLSRKRNRGHRRKLFIVTKAYQARTAADLEEKLSSSLKRMNTKYIDLFFAPHAMSNPSELTDELRQWAESAKKRKLIRFFGFSTHRNMAGCLAAAAKLNWIDAIMTSYNFRLMQDAKMQAAIEACYKANIGLIAMKVTGQTTLGWARQKLETEEDKKLIQHFLQRGFTQEQATIKLVLQDKRISSACIGMENVAVLTSNVAAVLDKTKLTQADADVFKEYAEATCSGYCAGCANICDSALPAMPYVSDIMRYLMYYNSYGDEDKARELFAQIPGDVRNKLLRTDYSVAEACCPQHIPISKFIAEAVSNLS